MSIDAIFSETIATYINDATKKYSNCKMEEIVRDDHLLLVVKKYILENMEIIIYYGDMKNLWWREQVYSYNMHIFSYTCVMNIIEKLHIKMDITVFFVFVFAI